MSKPIIPVRHSLVHEAAQIVQDRLAAGEWAEQLPGERILADHLQVSRDTIRGMLCELEARAVLLPAEPGRARQVHPSFSRQRKAKTPTLRVGILSPHPLERISQPILLELDQLRGAIGARSGSLRILSPSWYQQRNPARRLEELVATESCSAWVLLRSSAAVQRWFEQNDIPCLIRGYPHSGVELPFLDVDWEATARHAALRLWRLGHRRVGLFVPQEDLQGITAAVRGAQTVTESDFQLLEIPEWGDRQSLARALESALRSPKPPTALIGTRPRHAASALSWLAQHRIRVPEDISLLSLGHEPFMDHFISEISGYSVDPASIAKRLIRRLEGLSTSKRAISANSWLEPTIIEGASIGPPRS